MRQSLHTLTIETKTRGLIEITREVLRWVAGENFRSGLLTIYCRHTSASLLIQENADPDVQTDLTDALNRLAPQHAGYIHDTEGPDDMPAHIKAMLTGVSLTIPVQDGKAALGTWQGMYLIEHRHAPHTREIVLQFIGTCAG